METGRTAIPLTEIKGKIDIVGICISACPHLATEYDDITPMGFPHPGNRCYRYGDPRKRQLQFQRSFCLTDDFTSCSIYQSQEQSRQSEDNPVQKQRKSRGLRLAVPALLALILLVALITGPVLSRSFIQSAALNVPFDLDSLRTFIQELPETGTQPALPTELNGPDKHEGTNLSKSKTALRFPTSDALPDADTRPPVNEENGSFRAVPYTSD